MHYTISYNFPNKHFLDIVLFLDDVSEEEIFLQLPAWRPGRYELANFSKNIQKFNVLNEKGEALSFRKVSKDRWYINSANTSKIYIHYNYYAFQMDAGGSYLDESQLYINFINCLVYDEQKMNETCRVYLKIPDDYQVACGLSQPQKHTLQALNYYQLVDSPMIASNQLQHLSYKVEDYIFHIWIMGEVNIDKEKVLNDFLAFTQKQIEIMKGFPHPDYHFLFQILPYRHYHGVEHFNSTVITIGPSEKFYKDEFYNNVLGVSSHELFHTWNMIRIRPKEMLPYDFSRENYFKTGFVAEGFTTYYGDLFLVRSGVYNKSTYLRELNTTIKRHFDNFGRKNLSLTASSFDLWLDGYVAGIPNRKVSIYIKGAIIALMLDLEIRSSTKNNKSLDDVVRYLWDEFGKKNKGYSKQDILIAIESVTGGKFGLFLQKFIDGTDPEEKKLEELLQYVGCKLNLVEEAGYEENFGFKIIHSEGLTRVSNIEPGSQAEAWLSIDDELIAVNDRKIENNLADLTGNNKEIKLSLFRNKKLKNIQLINNGERYWKNYEIIQNTAATQIEKDNFQLWLGCSW